MNGKPIGDYSYPPHSSVDNKQFVILIGGPSSGKGFFLEKEKMSIIMPYLNPQKREDFNIQSALEGDSLLRMVQKNMAISQFNILMTTKTRREWLEEISKMYYLTGDGLKVRLISYINYNFWVQLTKKEIFENLLPEFRKKKKEFKEEQDQKIISKKDIPVDKKLFEIFWRETEIFWNSMRSWRDDSVGREGTFKKATRSQFNKEVEKMAKIYTDNLIVIDSPGEDVYKQPYVKQCETASNFGFVTNIVHLDPRIEGSNLLFMRLSNLNRGIEGKRMVDDRDLVGYTVNEKRAIVKIKTYSQKGLSIDRYFHIQKNLPSAQSIFEILERAGIDHQNGKNPEAFNSNTAKIIREKYLGEWNQVVQSILYSGKWEISNGSMGLNESHFRILNFNSWKRFS